MICFTEVNEFIVKQWRCVLFPFWAFMKRDVSKHVEDVCDLLNREMDRVCKEMEARTC